MINPHTPLRDESDIGEFEEQLVEIFEETAELLRNKRLDYGPGNLTLFGMHGILVRMADKVERLRNLHASGRLPQTDSYEDSWRDLLGYSALAVRLLKLNAPAEQGRDVINLNDIEIEASHEATIDFKLDPPDLENLLHEMSKLMKPPTFHFDWSGLVDNKGPVKDVITDFVEAAQETFDALDRATFESKAKPWFDLLVSMRRPGESLEDVVARWVKIMDLPTRPPAKQLPLDLQPSEELRREMRRGPYGF